MIKFSTVGKGTYAAVKFTDNTLNAIKNIQQELGLLDPVPVDKLHTTICFSRKYVDYIPVDTQQDIGFTKELDIFEHNGKRALVLLLDSEYLKYRHNYAKSIGATYDFPDYKPHITLQYDLGVQHIDYQNIDVSGKSIEMLYEYVEDLDLEWSDK